MTASFGRRLLPAVVVAALAAAYAFAADEVNSSAAPAAAQPAAPAAVQQAPAPPAAPAAVQQAPAPPAAPVAVISQKLEGIVLVKDPKDIVKSGVSGFKGLRADQFPAIESDLDFRDHLKEYLGKPFAEAERAKLVNELISFFQRGGKPVVDVTTPPQDVTAGVLQVLVIQGKLSSVKVEGNRWFRSEQVSDQFRNRAGEDIDSKTLADDLDWVNRNPFRRVDLVFVKGSELGKTDVVLREADAFPVRVYGGYEDSGTQLTRNDRFLAGASWGNVFGRDGQLNYQYIFSPEEKYFRAHSGLFVQPLPWRHTLSIYGGYASTVGRVPEPFSLTGFSWQTGMRYEVPLPRLSFADFRHSLVAGFDFKRSNNNLAFGGSSVFGETVDIAEWSAGYNMSFKDPFGASSVRATYVYSPGGITAADRTAIYDAARSGSRADFNYGKIELNRTTGLPFDFSLVNLLTFQFSNNNLQASEQLGFGGYDTIRGFDTRVFNADRGCLLTGELRAPAFSLLSMMGLRSLSEKLGGDRLQFLGFADYGAGGSVARLPGEANQTRMLGAGPGLRYAIASNLQVRADYGWQVINDAQPVRKYTARTHVGVTLSF